MQRLEPGDILIQKNRAKPFDKKDFEDFAHCMIYVGDNNVIHATQGKYVSAVAKHSIHKIFPLKALLGKGFILRIADEVLRKTMVEHAEKTLGNSMPTKFNYWDARKEYKTNAGHAEFFRAFRTNHRLFMDQSISKNKGISCSNFAFLILKSALVSLVFPHGMPEEVKMQLQAVEKLRIEQKNKKLDEVPLDEFIKFETLVSKYLIKDNHYTQFLPDLFQLVKHTNLQNLVKYALQQPKVFSQAYLYYEENDDLQPYVMDENTIKTMQKDKGWFGMKLSIKEVESFSSKYSMKL